MAVKNAIINAMLLPDSSRVFVIGCFERRITVYSQQIRALNLAYSMIESGLADEHSNIAVIGGGIAGITVAAGLHTVRCKITLFEKADELCHLQKGSDTRYIHPYIYDWPDTISKKQKTQLPFLNWNADTAANVIKEILQDWKSIQTDIKILLNQEVKEVYEFDDYVELKYGEGILRNFDHVIYAGGFGIEKSCLPNDFNSYWRDEAMHQHPLHSNNLKVFIAGCGDGGLIDCIRIRIKDFEHKEITQLIQDSDELTEVGKKMQIIDDQLEKSGIIDRNEQSKVLLAQYKKLYIPNFLSETLYEKKRGNIESQIISDLTETPFKLHTSYLNRLLVFAMFKSNLIKYIRGSDDCSEIEKLKAIGYLPIERKGANSEFKKILNLNATHDKAIHQKRVELDNLKIGIVNYYPNRFFTVLRREISELKILFVYNQEQKYAQPIINSFHSNTSKIELQFDLRISYESLTLNPDKFFYEENLRLLNTYITTYKPDIVSILSSDLCIFSESVIENVNALILVGEEMTNSVTWENLRQKFPSKTICTIIQKANLPEIIRLLQLAFPNGRIGYVYSPQHLIDKEYLEKISDLLKLYAQNNSDFNLKIFPVELLESQISEFKKEYDIYIGRYFVHVNAWKLFEKAPFASGYGADLTRGAIMSFDMDDKETGKILCLSVVKDILTKGTAVQKKYEVSERILSINNKAAKKFGIQMNEEIMRIADYKTK